MNLADLRQDYRQKTFSEADAHHDALQQFQAWLNEVLKSELPEPNAMTLGTVGQDGFPAVRVVLLKGLDNGFVFYSNYESRKAQELAAHPKAVLNFNWLELERQVRVQGTVEKVSRQESETYFHSRPRGSQIGAWVSPQSQVIESRDVLEKRQQEFEQKFANEEKIPLPPNWGGYRLTPTTIEFWQGRPSRLHDRLLYTRQQDGTWNRKRLAP